MDSRQTKNRNAQYYSMTETVGKRKKAGGDVDTRETRRVIYNVSCFHRHHQQVHMENHSRPLTLIDSLSDDEGGVAER